MSADNGVYILRTKRTMREETPGSWVQGEDHYVWRVADTSAIDNFDFIKKNQAYNLGCYMLDVWKNSAVYLTEDAAQTAASKLANKFYEDCFPLEYGISHIDTDYIFWGDY